MKLRLQELIQESGKTHKELSEILKKLKKVATTLDCSIDFLLGRE